MSREIAKNHKRRLFLAQFMASLTGIMALCATDQAKAQWFKAAPLPIDHDQHDPHSEAYTAPDIAFAAWSDDEPEYVFFPGDKIEVQFPYAPELSRTVQVRPDGRISLGLIGEIMVAYKNPSELQDLLRARYGPILRHPEVNVFPAETAPIKLIIAGSVKNPGMIDMVGDMDALQAVMAAGGFLPGSQTKKVVIIRRNRQGQAMRLIIDLQSPLGGQSHRLYALKRMDIVFVPRTHLGEAADFMSQIFNGLVPYGVQAYFAAKVH